MIRDALFVARKDLQYMLRSRETLVWVFVMPIVFFYFIGSITGGFGGSGSGKTAVVLHADDSAGFLVDRLTTRLEEQDYVIVRPDTAGTHEKYSRHLTVPAAFTDSVLAGVQSTVHFRHKGEGMTSDYEAIRAGRAVYTVLADLVAVQEDGTAPTPESLAALDAMPRALSIDVSTAGNRKRIPTGFEQAVPGTLVMFILLVMTTSGAVLLVIERRQGLMRRLASAPIDRRAVVLGKVGGKLGLGLVQIAFAMLTGMLLFGVDWGANWPVLLLVLLVYGALMATLGVVLGSVARSEGQAVAIGVISANALGALGGCWWPIEITPEWMQRFALFLPTGWAMDAVHKLVSFVASPVTVVPHVVGMGLGVVLLLWLAERVFRFE
ncbi:MAG: ABC transporter permease [Gemmatimonadetes bacterium]|nr:ABC transporter permease [Gemmatimonadota bacterium]